MVLSRLASDWLCRTRNLGNANVAMAGSGAQHPRIILDPQCLLEFGLGPRLVDVENGTTFLDSLSVPFFERLWEGSPHVFDKYLSDVAWGLKIPAELYLRVSLEKILGFLQKELRLVVHEKERAKLTWLQDRISGRLATMRTLDELAHIVIP